MYLRVGTGPHGSVLVPGRLLGGETRVERLHGPQQPVLPDKGDQDHRLPVLLLTIQVLYSIDVLTSSTYILFTFCYETGANRMRLRWPRTFVLTKTVPVAVEPVLWIRIGIRNNPNFLAGSESEKKFGFGFGSSHCSKIKNCEKSQIKHLKEKKT
jgi:hypothetical protein